MKTLLLIILILIAGIAGATITNLVSFNCNIADAAEFCIDLPESRQTYGSSKDNDNLGAAITPVFPGDFNNHIEDEIIEEEDINILDSVIGLSFDRNATSHDYMLRHGSTSTQAYASTTFPTFGYASSTYFIQADATTTLDYWETQQANRAFSTSSADGWAAQTNISLFVNDAGYLEEATASTTYLQIGYASTTFPTFDYASTTFLSWENASSSYLPLTGGTLTDILSGTEIDLTYGISAATSSITAASTTANFHVGGNLTITGTTTDNIQKDWNYSINVKTIDLSDQNLTSINLSELVKTNELENLILENNYINDLMR